MSATSIRPTPENPAWFWDIQRLHDDAFGTAAAHILRTPLPHGHRLEHGILEACAQVWQEQTVRKRRRMVWIVSIREDMLHAQFDGELTPLSRAVLGAILDEMTRQEEGTYR